MRKPLQSKGSPSSKLLALSFLLLALSFSALSFSASAQAVTASTTAVMVNDAGVVVWPPNLWTANAANFASPTQGAKADTAVQAWYNLLGVDTGVTGRPQAIRFTSGASSYHITLYAPSSIPTGGYSVSLPTKGGTLALTSDIPAAAPVGWLVCTIQIKTAPGDTWTDFEFKIMTQSGGVITLHLYYHSPDPGRSVVSGQIGTVAGVWFTSSSTTGDSRLLRKQSSTQSIWQQIGGGSNTTTSVMIAVPVTAIIRPDNAGLFAEYLRFSPTDHEKDSSGRSVWRLADLQWRTVLPNP
ncbi:hypothetical protein [Geminisphaera colitermitum]|uniref:hypothetical protein n=1 Tax=Geminisphaera colitermitum TaxID=1148786 RepID=UPI000158C4F8|nr:hypothetical protein [Geminisphaera colitermitum]